VSFPAAEMEAPSPAERWLPSKRQARLVAIWCGLYLVYATAGHLYGWPWALPASLLVWLAALVLMIVGLFHLRMLRKAPVATLLTVALLPAAAIVAVPALHGAAVWIAFELRRGELQAVVDDVENGRLQRVGGRTAGGIAYIVEEGQPFRIAFVTQPGVVDNWGGIVYDPTHGVAAAVAPSWTDAGRAVPDQVRELFGGDIVTCQHIDGFFYRCGFT
jgi:hypothetical protein